jgi:SAM-dependent methyltransferase
VTALGSSSQCPVCASAAAPDAVFSPAPLLRCTICTFAFLDGPANPALYDDGYFAAYAGGDYLAEERQRRHEARLRLDLLATTTPAPARVLEVGAAAGFLLDEARVRGYEAVGIEPNDAMAAHARDTLGLDVRTGLLGETALEDDAFEAACAFHVLEHVDDPLDALRTIRIALKPGGHLLVEVPNAASAVARRQGADWQPLDLPHHVGHHSPGSLRVLLSRSGFELVQLDTVPFAFYGARTRAQLLRQTLGEALRARTLLPPRPHSEAHQLLRAIGRRPVA